MKKVKSQDNVTRVIYKLKYLLFRCRKLNLPMQKVIPICFVEGRIIHRVCWALCLAKWDRSTLNKSLRCSTGIFNQPITGAYGFPVINLVDHRVYSSAAGENFWYSGYFSEFALRSVLVCIPVWSFNGIVQNICLFRKNPEIFGLQTPLV